jgi:fimbrial chaperone protein
MALSKIAAASLAAIACVASMLPARAGQFTVKPIHVFVNGSARSLIMTVENDADTPLRLQVTGFHWVQTPTGEMKLDPTDDLVFFPTLVTVPAQASQVIRVAVGAQPSAVEQSYRLFFEELPSLDSQIVPGRGEHLSFRTKLGIPVFFAPTQAVQKTSLAAAWGAPHRLDVAVKNDGSVHTMLYNLVLSAKSQTGQTVFTKKLDGWYLLAKGERDFHVALTKALCARTASIHLTATFEDARIISQDVTEPCAH